MKIRSIVILSPVGLFLSTVLVLAGVFLLRGGETVVGLSVVAAAMALFAVSFILSEAFPPTDEEAAIYKPYIIPALLGVLSLGLIFYSLYLMSNFQRNDQENRLMIAAWAAGMLAAGLGILWAVRWRPPRWEKIKQEFGQSRREWLILVAILFAGFFLRFYLLEQHPFPWSGDEASVGIEARRVIAGEVTDFFDAGWSGQPNWSFIPTTVSLLVFGQSFFAIRLVSALEGTLALLFVYLVAVELFGNKRVGLMAAGFLAAFPYHLQFSRIGVNNVADTLVVCVVVWLVLRAIRKGGLDDYVWAGLATGLTFYTYVGSRLVLGLAFLIFIYAAISRKGFLKSRWGHLILYLSAAAIAIAPMAYYFIRHPDIFMTRLGQESIFINHWLSLQAERSGQSVAYLLWRQFADTILVYISSAAGGNFFNSPIPYLTIIGSVFFLFGMGYAFARFFKLEMITLMAWFWSVVILGGVMTTSPPANTRLIMTAPAVAIFLALGLEKVMGMLVRIKISTAAWQVRLSAFFLFFLGIQNTVFYFGKYRTENFFEDATGELTQFVGQELKELGPEYDYYLLGLPRVFAAFPTVVFLAPKSGWYDITGESIDSMILPRGRGVMFVAIPENLSDLQRIAQRFPGGTWEEVPRVYRVEVLYYAYILPASAVP